MLAYKGLNLLWGKIGCCQDTGYWKKYFCSSGFTVVGLLCFIFPPPFPLCLHSLLHYINVAHLN